MIYPFYIIGLLVSLALFFHANADYVHARREGCDYHATQYLNIKLNSVVWLVSCLIYLVRHELKRP